MKAVKLPPPREIVHAVRASLVYTVYPVRFYLTDTVEDGFTAEPVVGSRPADAYAVRINDNYLVIYSLPDGVVLDVWPKDANIVKLVDAVIRGLLNGDIELNEHEKRAVAVLFDLSLSDIEFIIRDAKELRRIARKRVVWLRGYYAVLDEPPVIVWWTKDDRVKQYARVLYGFEHVAEHIRRYSRDNSLLALPNIVLTCNIRGCYVIKLPAVAISTLVARFGFSKNTIDDGKVKMTVPGDGVGITPTSIHILRKYEKGYVSVHQINEKTGVSTVYVITKRGTVLTAKYISRKRFFGILNEQQEGQKARRDRKVFVKVD